MKVIMADYSGFCFGVERAIDTAFEQLNKKESKNIYSLGPLIHNHQVIDQFEEKGLYSINDLEDGKDGTIIIRSHGVPKKIYEEAEEKDLTIIDSTCPFVKKIQMIVKEHWEKGYNIIIIGSAEHPEVIGINGWCDNTAYILNNENDVENIPFQDHLCVVVQTTMSLKSYIHITDILEKKFNDIVKFNTICSATRDRQASASNLSKDVEAMIVIGGYHSSNTQKLVDVCKQERPDTTFHIETVDELPIPLLKEYTTIGITAGASTPKWIIDEVIHTLNKL